MEDLACRGRLRPLGDRLEGWGSARPVLPGTVAEWRRASRGGGATTEQDRHFLDFVADHRPYALFHLLVMTGLRRGEVVALR